jgi:membrane-associated protein
MLLMPVRAQPGVVLACHDCRLVVVLFPTSPARPGEGIPQERMKLIGWIIGVELPPLDELLAQWANGMGPWFYVILFAIIFSETGLVVAPFLPGDSLLFAVGALAAVDARLGLLFLLVLLTVAAVLGDAVNYAVGYRVGPAIFRSNSSRLFNRAHLFKAQAFYEKYGNKTIILARFVPIVRTFAPFVAGIGKMEYRRFALYNIVGAIAWVLLCTCGGYYFGTMKWVKENFEAVAVAIVFISVLPIAIEAFLHWRRARGAKPEPAAVAGSVEAAPDRVAM